jgi:hypothetical protein
VVAESIRFVSGHASHDFRATGTPALRVHTAWACPDRSHTLQLEPVDSPGSPDAVILRLVLVPTGGFVPPEPTTLTAECTIHLDGHIGEVVVFPSGTSLPVTRWTTAHTARKTHR